MSQFEKERADLTDWDLINLVQDYAAQNPKFDDTFVNSCEEWLETSDELTVKQRAALLNIIYAFKLEEEE